MTISPCSRSKIAKSCLVKLYKDKVNIGVQWQTYTDWDNSKLVKPKRIKRSLNALGSGKSTVAKIASYLHGCSINSSSDTFA